MAQRMESVAPPGGVMLSESTARLVEHATSRPRPRRCTSRAVMLRWRPAACLAWPRAVNERAPGRSH